MSGKEEPDHAPSEDPQLDLEAELEEQVTHARPMRRGLHAIDGEG